MLTTQAKAVLADLARKSSAQIDPADDAQKLAQARALTGSLADYSGTAPAEVTAEEVELDDLAGPIRVRLYRPGEGGECLLIWYHGGGAMAGSLDSHDTALRQLSAATGRVIASVDYRLAPEHVSPAPQQDCIAATRALLARAREFGCDPDRVAIGGDSIGGLFAAVVAIALRDAGEAMPSAMIMLYPNTDLRPDRPFASLDSEAGNVMTRESLAYENTLFVPRVEDRTDPSVSPLLAPDLSRLPSTLLVLCEHDPLRDEGEAFGRRLAEAGVRLEQRLYPGMIHGFLQMDGWIETAADLRTDIAHFLSSH
ncbi:alpha/beta hydrolase [Jiella marina]|uniref:alpha/beta hydrolase n=1 Tax=Jiella sp. LLJ827 TaxID=2917712 RepID=UPI002101596B|nr:alpha/beta hydrolase [Jiella sp. LLJ827]MCQ0988965.1 alpha/beta hydrolase [Jiella sp. LLJ827]